MKTELKVGDLVMVHHKTPMHRDGHWGVVMGIRVNDDNLLEYCIFRGDRDFYSWHNGISLWRAVWTFVGPVVIERCALGLRSGSPTE